MILIPVWQYVLVIGVSALGGWIASSKAHGVLRRTREKSRPPEEEL